MIDFITEWTEDKICKTCIHSSDSDYVGWLRCGLGHAQELTYPEKDEVVSKHFGCNKWKETYE